MWEFVTYAGIVVLAFLFARWLEKQAAEVYRRLDRLIDVTHELNETLGRVRSDVYALRQDVETINRRA
jgi:hypothetical protein